MAIRLLPIHMPILLLISPVIRPGDIIIIRDNNNIRIVRLADHGLGGARDGIFGDDGVQQSGAGARCQLLDLCTDLVDAVGGSCAFAAEALGDDLVARRLGQGRHHPRGVVGAVHDVLAGDAHAPDVVVHDDDEDVQVVARVRVKLLDVEARRPVAVDA